METPFICACRYDGTPALLEMLLQHEPEIQVTHTSLFHDRPIHWVCMRPADGLLDVLLRYGPEEQIFYPDGGQQIPLHFACSCGHVENVERLLQHKPELQVIHGNQEDVLPLFCACESGSLEIVQLLLAYRAKEQILHVTEHDNLAVEALCAFQLEIMALLLQVNPAWQLQHKEQEWQRRIAHSEEWFEAFTTLFCRRVLQEEHLPLITREGTMERMKNAIMARTAPKSARSVGQ